MFDFQKEVVINNVKQFGDSNAENVLIDGMVYKKDNLGEEGIFRTKFVEGDVAELTIDAGAIKTLAEAASSTHVQIRIELGLDRDYRGDYGSALYYFRKPVVVDLEVANLNDAAVAKAFKTAIPSNYKFLSVKSENGVDVAPTVLVAEDSYITLRKVELVGFACEASCSDSMEMPVFLADVNTENGPFTVKDNVVAFGTYEYLLHNLRLPTYANIRFTSPAAVEMPVLGGKYWQYSFEYAVPRRIGGLSVVGQKNVSVTTHTFFVLDGDVQVAFDAYISKLGTPVDYPKVVTDEDPAQGE